MLFRSFLNLVPFVTLVHLRHFFEGVFDLLGMLKAKDLSLEANEKLIKI